MPKGLEGLSMVPLLENPKRTRKKAAFSQFPRPWLYKGQPQLMGYTMRTDRYRYTEWIEFSTKRIQARELYDHQIDPMKTVNLVNSPGYADTVRKLSRILHEG